MVRHMVNPCITKKDLNKCYRSICSFHLVNNGHSLYRYTGIIACRCGKVVLSNMQSSQFTTKLANYSRPEKFYTYCSARFTLLTRSYIEKAEKLNKDKMVANYIDEKKNKERSANNRKDNKDKNVIKRYKRLKIIKITKMSKR